MKFLVSKTKRTEIRSAPYPCPRCMQGTLEVHDPVFQCDVCKSSFTAQEERTLLYPNEPSWKIQPIYWWDGWNWQVAGSTNSFQKICTFVAISAIPPLLIILLSPASIHTWSGAFVVWILCVSLVLLFSVDHVTTLLNTARPRARVLIHNANGLIQSGNGQAFESAAQLLAEARAILESAGLADNNVDAAWLLASGAFLHRRRGNLVGAVKLLTRAIAIAEHCCAPASIDVLVLNGQLALTRLEMGDMEAAPIMEDICSRMEKHQADFMHTQEWLDDVRSAFLLALDHAKTQRAIPVEHADRCNREFI